MPRVLTPMILAASLLGCTRVDNPDNRPLLGQWEERSRLVALTIDGLAIDRSALPFALPPDRAEHHGCAEPYFRNPDDVESAIARAADQRCHIAAFDRTGDTMTGSGSCESRVDRGVKFGATFSFAGVATENLVTGQNAVDGFAHLPDGQTEHVHLAYVIDWHRTGGC